MPVEKDGTIIIYMGEFGWETEDFSDAETKASYCWTWANGEEKTKYKKMLSKVIKEQTGATKVKFVEGCSSTSRYNEDLNFWEDVDKSLGLPDSDEDDMEPLKGYIDHQSYDVCRKAFRNENSLRRFIFSTKSILRIDNDNH